MSSWNKIGRTIVGVFIGLSGFNSMALVNTSSSSLAQVKACETIQPYDRAFPWPWDLAVNITIKDLHGVWIVVDGGSSDQFVFDVKSNKRNSGYLSINTYSSQNCQLVGQGIGYQTNDHSIYGQIITTTGMTLNLSVYAFNLADVEHQMGKAGYTMDSGDLKSGVGSLVMAMSMTALQSNDQTPRSAFVIRRISTKSAATCTNHEN